MKRAKRETRRKGKVKSTGMVLKAKHIRFTKLDQIYLILINLLVNIEIDYQNKIC